MKCKRSPGVPPHVLRMVGFSLSFNGTIIMSSIASSSFSVSVSATPTVSTTPLRELSDIHEAHSASDVSSFTISSSEASASIAPDRQRRNTFPAHARRAGSFGGMFTNGGGEPDRGPPARPGSRSTLVEEQAQTALRRSNFSAAIAAYKNALSAASSRTTDVADPSMPRLQAGLSQAYAGTKDFAGALRASEACIRLDPQWHEGHACRARALNGRGAFRLAAEAFEAAFRLAVAEGVAGTAVASPSFRPYFASSIVFTHSERYLWCRCPCTALQRGSFPGACEVRHTGFAACTREGTPPSHSQQRVRRT